MNMIRDPHRTMRELSDTEWAARLEEIAEEDGYFEPLGPSHFAMFVDNGPVLLVSFETRKSVRTRHDAQEPLGYTVAKSNGWSSLSLICHDESWFRSPEVYAYIDRLIDEAFFEDFDHVLFYGAGSCGYAAAAFSVAAPGATVIAVQPQATLDPRLTGWDRRFVQMRRTAFDTRYGFAPDMLDGVGQAFIIFDPSETLDAMHAALFARPCVSLLPCRHLGGALDTKLAEMGILETILSEVGAGRFDSARFWKLYRARRRNARYLRRLASRLEALKRPRLEAMLCRNVALRMQLPQFRARWTELEEQLRTRGGRLPTPLSAAV